MQKVYCLNLVWKLVMMKMPKQWVFTNKGN